MGKRERRNILSSSPAPNFYSLWFRQCLPVFSTWGILPPFKDIQQMSVGRINDSKMYKPLVFKEHRRLVRKGRKIWVYNLLAGNWDSVVRPQVLFRLLLCLRDSRVSSRHL